MATLVIRKREQAYRQSLRSGGERIRAEWQVLSPLRLGPGYDNRPFTFFLSLLFPPGSSPLTRLVGNPEVRNRARSAFLKRLRHELSRMVTRDREKGSDWARHHCSALWRPKRSLGMQNEKSNDDIFRRDRLVKGFSTIPFFNSPSSVAQVRFGGSTPDRHF